MNEPRSTLTEETAPEAVTDPAAAMAPLIEADDLLEEISIDGMCGVY
ncbi:MULTISPECIES: mycofactocin precursor MftA [Streptomyces]|uniref:Mycofactocin MftA n=2 Tax=Streptomyces TaxID=1883 RepID=A0ABV9INB5_9ACTN